MTVKKKAVKNHVDVLTGSRKADKIERRKKGKTARQKKDLTEKLTFYLEKPVDQRLRLYCALNKEKKMSHVINAVLKEFLDKQELKI